MYDSTNDTIRVTSRLLQLVDYAINDSEAREKADIELDTFRVYIANSIVEFDATHNQLKALFAFVESLASSVGCTLDDLRKATDK